MDAIPVVLFWVFGIWGMFSRRPVLIYLFFCSLPFGSFAAIPPAVTGSLTLTPTPVVALLIVIRFLGSGKALERSLSLAVKPSRLLQLTLFWIISVFTTLLMPRLFAGNVAVIPMRADLLIATQLQPTTQNISQLAYLTISVFATFAFVQALRTDAARQDALGAMVWGGILVVVSGFADFAGQYLPLQPVLEPFRTATYSLLTDVEIFGGKRVVGLMPEASSFGGLCLTFLGSLYFFRRAMLDTFLRDRVTPILMFFLLLMVWMSTSSAAYVGLGVLFAVIAGEWCWRAAASRPNPLAKRGLGLELTIAIVALSAICVVILFRPDLLNPVTESINRMVFEKAASDSFEERSMWTAVSWHALMSTYGLGVGMGATRASNGVVAIVSNTGVLASALYFGFLLQTFLRRANKGDDVGGAMISAFHWSYLPSFTISVLAGTSADFGSYNGMLFAIVMAIALPPVAQNAARPWVATARRQHA
jgi:hypothetical protein